MRWGATEGCRHLPVWVNPEKVDVDALYGALKEMGMQCVIIGDPAEGRAFQWDIYVRGGEKVLQKLKGELLSRFGEGLTFGPIT